ncbi:CDGSH iron-sulfur domain-containing protein [Diaminobutyricibacter sp. McL0618]|uniref:CDGSH iron-sulfur domain-containing protein n=1 Tax=Leifsonia sp. McL0618 TaxID=3415677 RepID=UPI003CF7EDED
MTQPDENEPLIVACTDGPLLVRGSVTIVNSDGERIPQHRRTVALCRCGVSAIKPFCDGTHKLIHFTTDPARHDATASS